MVGGALTKPQHLQRLFKDAPGGQWLEVKRRPGRAPSEGLPTILLPQILHSPDCGTPTTLAATFPESLGKRSSLYRRKGGDCEDREMTWEEKVVRGSPSALGKQ